MIKSYEIGPSVGYVERDPEERRLNSVVALYIATGMFAIIGISIYLQSKGKLPVSPTYVNPYPPPYYHPHSRPGLTWNF